MQIECTIKRPGGSKVQLDKNTYHFKPKDDHPDTPHVAEVTDEAHCKRLLSIREAYRGVGKEGEAAQKQADAALTKGSGTDGHIKSPEEMDADVVSEETVQELLEGADELMAAKKKTSADQLTNKDVSDLFKDIVGLNPANKKEISRFAAGVEVELPSTMTQPAALLKYLLVKLAEKFPAEESEEDDGAEESDEQE